MDTGANWLVVVGGLIGLAIALLILAIILWIPGRIARKRNHPQWEAIDTCAYCGIFFPPLWFVALIWAHTVKEPPLHRSINPHMEAAKQKAWEDAINRGDKVE